MNLYDSEIVSTSSRSAGQAIFSLSILLKQQFISFNRRVRILLLCLIKSAITLYGTKNANSLIDIVMFRRKYEDSRPARHFTLGDRQETLEKDDGRRHLRQRGPARLLF